MNVSIKHVSICFKELREDRSYSLCIPDNATYDEVEEVISLFSKAISEMRAQAEVRANSSLEETKNNGEE